MILPGHGQVKQVEELFERGLVHTVDQAHLYDQEVQDATASRHRSELLSRHRDLCLGLCSYLQFLADILRCAFGCVQHIYQIFIIHQRSLKLTN